MRIKVRNIVFGFLTVCVSLCLMFSMAYPGQSVYAAQPDTGLMEDGSEADSEMENMTENQSETANAEILELMRAKMSLAVRMNVAEYALETMTLTKSPEKMFAAYYADGTFNGQESVLYLNQEPAWCLEPSELVGNAGAGITYALAESGDAAQWLQNRYGWSWSKINNLAKAVCFAKQYFGDHGMCGYALVQDLIWSEIQPYEDSAEAGYYLLTNGAENTAYQCGHLDTKEKMNQAIQNVWQQFYSYNTLPSYQGQSIYLTPGQSCWIPDVNGVTDKTSFITPPGVQVAAGWNGNSNGIWLSADESFAGQTVTVNFYKNEIPAGSEGILVYGATDKKRQTIGLWSGAISPTYGSFRIVCERKSYLNASYQARDAVSPTFDIHIQKTDAETGKNLSGARFDIFMDGNRVASVITDTEGKASYHWRGETLYTSYYKSVQAVRNFSDWETAYEAARQNVAQKIEEAVKQLKSETRHTWKVQEIQAPDGYVRNEEVWEQNFDLNALAVEVSYTNTPENGYLNMQKISENPELTEKNPCYSLAGAEYGVYRTLEDAEEGKERISLLKTDETGSSDTQTLPAGTYYVKELTASPGYQLCTEVSEDGVPSGIHRVEVKSNETTTFTCMEEAAGKNLILDLQKYDAETKTADAPGTSSLKGAVFSLEYYANINGTVNQTPYRTWYFQTDDTGSLNSGKKEYFVEELRLQDGTTLRSDEIYQDEAGNSFYPIGTYRIREVCAPKYYKKAGEMFFEESPDMASEVTEGLTALMIQPETGTPCELYASGKKTEGKVHITNLSLSVYDVLQKGSITLYKTSANQEKEPLQGVTFRMIGQDTEDEYTAVTDKEGKIVWEDLIPQTYRITEIKTQNGKNLLKESIDVTLPLEMDASDILKNGMNREDAIYDEESDKYCFYQLTYRVGNTPILEMPFAGEMNQRRIYIIMVGGLGLVMFAVIWKNGKKESGKNNRKSPRPGK